MKNTSTQGCNAKKTNNKPFWHTSRTTNKHSPSPYHDQNIFKKISIQTTSDMRHAVTQFVESLRCNPKGRGFDFNIWPVSEAESFATFMCRDRLEILGGPTSCNSKSLPKPVKMSLKLHIDIHFETEMLKVKGKVKQTLDRR